MRPEEFSERLWEFAARVGKAVDALPDTRLGRHVARQLVRCGTASAPNYDEARSAESRDDFVHKLGIATKEMRESHGWLRFTIRAGLLPAKKIAAIADESEQLLKMLSKSVHTAKPRADLAALPPSAPISNQQSTISNSQLAIPPASKASIIWPSPCPIPNRRCNSGVTRSAFRFSIARMSTEAACA